MKNNLINRSKRKDVTGLICVVEFDEEFNVEDFMNDKADYVARHAKVENTFSSIDELKLFYHDKPIKGYFTELQRWRLLACLFDCMLFTVQLFQLITQIISGASGWTIGFTTVALVVITVCTIIMARQTIKDWGD